MTAPSHPTRIGPEYSPLPLNGSFVRLLDILPGDHGSSIHCNLRVASLRSQLSYKALSYAWIDENISTSRSKGELIICNGRQVLIPSNLHSALQTFKSTTSILTLWVDFLCINQQDTQERNRQVAMMRSIYSNSSEVLIWLGPNTSGDHLGDGRTARSTTGSNSYKVVWHNDTRDEDIVRSYIELFSRYEHLGEHVMPIPWSRDVFGAFVVLNQLAKGSSMRNLRFYKAALMSSEQIRWASLVQKGISALVDSSWWQRTWVIQETVLPRKATVYFGHISAPWTMFAEGAATYVRELATSDLSENNLNEHDPRSRLSLPSGLPRLSKAHPDDRDPLSHLSKAILDLEAVRIARIDEVRLPLLSMLRRFRTKKSSDPRDKIYALLGLARESIQASIKPDYGLNEHEVMLQTTIAVITETRGLEPLAGRVAGPDYLNSWSTNWYDLPAGHERERLDCLGFYDASNGQSGIARLHGQALLELQGYCIGEVEYIGDEAPEDGFDRLRGFVTRWEQIWANLCASSSDSIYADEAGAFWRTITADTLYVGSIQHSSWSDQDTGYRRATSNGSAAFAAWKEDDSNKRRRKTSLGPAGLLKSYVEPEELTARKNSFHYALRTASGARRFFAAKDGFIGIGPAALRPGDTIHIVQGSRVPLIMRRRPHSTECREESVRNLFEYPVALQTTTEICNTLHDDIYALVGDAYVHGVMDGGFVRTLRELRSIYLL